MEREFNQQTRSNVRRLRRLFFNQQRMKGFGRDSRKGLPSEEDHFSSSGQEWQPTLLTPAPMRGSCGVRLWRMDCWTNGDPWTNPLCHGRGLGKGRAARPRCYGPALRTFKAGQARTSQISSTCCIAWLAYSDMGVIFRRSHQQIFWKSS